MAKNNIKKIADKERNRQLGFNENSPIKEYDVSKALKNIGGNAVDRAERNRQMGFNDYTPDNEYGLSNVDL